jgi:putative hydrolase of the HAD superfamily
MAIKAIFFDMGGTLQTFTYDRTLRLEATPGLQRILKDAGINLHLSDEELYEHVSKGMVGNHARRLETNEEWPSFRVWKEFILKDFKIDERKLESIAEELMLYLETRYYSRKLRPEVPVVLKQLKAMGMKIGLISNVVSLGQVKVNLKEYGIEKYFNPIVLSSEYGRRKPDPAIFHYAARLAKVPTSECLYVGDRIARDVLGAKRAGFHIAIQIVHDFKHGEQDEGAKPDAIIHSMTELIDIIKNDSSSSTHQSLKGNKRDTKIRAFLFDAGDILYHRPKRGAKFVSFLKEKGLNLDNGGHGKRQELQVAAYKGELTRDEYHMAVLNSFGLTTTEDISQGKEILEKEDNDIQIIKGVPETLKQLKAQGYYLGIITDTSVPVSTKLAWFEKAGFGHVWDSIVSSKEVGLKKPDPNIYHLALEQLGVHPRESIFVGHLKSELDGANNLGMLTVAFNKGEDATASYYVKNFSDLLELPCIKSKDKE